MARTDDLHHRDRCAIAGIGTTEFSFDSGRSELTLAVEACLAAVADAGMVIGDIDGIVRCENDAVRPNDLVDAMGMPGLSYFGEVGPGGTAPCAMVGQAVAAVLAGMATNVLVFRSLNGRSGYRYGAGHPTQAARSGGRSSYHELSEPYGLLAPGQIFAMMAQRHFAEFGTTSEDLGHIAMTCRSRAASNPAAVMAKRPMTMDDYLASRMISTPLRLFDYCLETDGACAVVVTSAARSADAPHPSVLIRAVAQGTPASPQPGRMQASVLRGSLTTLPGRAVADELYRRAGLGPAEIDVAQLYDCFTINVLIQLEDYGFCAKGEGGPFVRSGAVDLGGTIPINTSGGHLSEGYVHGMSLIVEGVRQLRGDSTAHVAGAETCLVTSTQVLPGSALILRTAA